MYIYIYNERGKKDKEADTLYINLILSIVRCFFLIFTFVQSIC